MHDHRSRTLFLALGAAVMTVAASAGQAPSQTRPSGYPGAEGVAVRPPVVDVPPVYAAPAIDTLATIRRRGRLRVGMAAAMPWVMHNREGEFMGYSVDLARKLADDIGVELEIVPTSWPDVIGDLVDNRFDVIASGLWITPARALLVNYTQSTSMASLSLVGGKAQAGSMARAQDFDRAGVSIAVNRGTEMEEVAARKFPKATLVRLGLDDDPLAAVLEGKAQAAVVLSPSARLTVASSGERLFLPTGADLTTASTALAVRKGDPDFLNFLDAWLTYHRETGWTAERQAYWFSSTTWFGSM